MIKKTIAKELGPEIFAQALAIFLDNADRDFTLLNLYIESQDYTNSKSMTHKLIGTCESIGVKKLPRILRIMDEDLKKRYVNSNNLKEANEVYEKLVDFIREEYEIELAQ
ncbi:MAG: hypothetical protein ACPGVD_00140 [Flavobacteriales bacterium]